MCSILSYSEIHQKAIRLREGGVEEIDGLWFVARESFGAIHPCDMCELDSICHGNVREVCDELDSWGKHNYFLALNH